MEFGDWIKRFAVALLGSAVLLVLVELAKGRQVIPAVAFGALWGAVFASVFTLVGYFRYRRNPACLLPPSRDQNDRV